MKAKNILLLLMMVIIAIVFFTIYVRHKNKERFTESSTIKFAPPGTYPPMNNCYEYAALSSANGYSLGWLLAEKVWDYISRAKILALLVPSKDYMLHTKDTGTLLNGKCEVPKDIQNTLGIDENCKLGNTHQLTKRDDGTCVIDMANENNVIPILDAAYEVYDADYLLIIRDLEAQITYYTEAKVALDSQIPVIQDDINRYNKLLIPITDHNNTIRDYNEKLRQCIKSTRDVKNKNITLLQTIREDILNTKEKIRRITEMMEKYKSYTGQEAPLPEPEAEPKPKTPPPTCRNVSLPWTDHGRWDVRFLDRQLVYCERDEVLKGFVLETNSTDAIRYKFTCCKTPSDYTNNPEPNYTNWDLNRSWQMEFLDRHNVDCGDRYLQGFHVKNDAVDAPKNIQYEMMCQNLRPNDPKKRHVVSNCKEFTTPHRLRDNLKSGKEGRMGWGGTYELAHHPIMCPNGTALTRFKMERDFRPRHNVDDIYYKYRCCAPGTQDIPEPPKPPPERKFKAVQIAPPVIEQTKYGNATNFTCLLQPFDT